MLESILSEEDFTAHDGLNVLIVHIRKTFEEQMESKTKATETVKARKLS